MQDVQVRHDHLGDEPIVVLTWPDGSTEATFALRGATLLSWRTRTDQGWLDLVDGYRDEAELVGLDGIRNGVMVPFVNRVAGGRYVFDGIEHDLQPGREGADRLTYHGLLYGRRYDDVSVVADKDRATVTFTCAVGPDVADGYPFDLLVSVRYELAPTELTGTVAAANVGDRPAPCGLGWHPYFSLGRPIDELELTIPSRTTVVVDEALIPVHEGALYRDLDRDDPADFSTGRRIGPAVLDTTYAHLRPAVSELPVTTLRDPGSGRALHVWQESGLMHVFTGDTLAARRRQSIALEPVQMVTDAFNRPDQAEAVRLEPNDVRTFVFGVDLELPGRIGGHAAVPAQIERRA